MKEKKNLPVSLLILEILNDHSGKLVIAQLRLKAMKKLFFASHEILEVLNDHVGKLVNAQ